MNRHEKLHTPETPYLCNVRGCWEKFADMNERDEHKKTRLQSSKGDPVATQ